MKIEFNHILERDFDLLLMRQFVYNTSFVCNIFLKRINLEYVKDNVSVLDVGHSVFTNDGESDIEVILQIGNKRVALLIEDKIDAVLQPNQATRYKTRGKKAVEDGCYDEFYTFIVAPEKYLAGNAENIKEFDFKVKYEDIKEVLHSEFDLAILDKALDESKKGYVPVEDKQITAFWDKLYDYIEANYPNEFVVHGKKGDIRGARASWVTFRCAKGFEIQIKADRGYVDLEIANCADKVHIFMKKNQELLDQKKLYLRIASKSLAIREYIEIIDFKKPFESQELLVDDALRKVIKLQKIINRLKI